MPPRAILSSVWRTMCSACGVAGPGVLTEQELGGPSGAGTSARRRSRRASRRSSRARPRGRAVEELGARARPCRPGPPRCAEVLGHLAGRARRSPSRRSVPGLGDASSRTRGKPGMPARSVGREVGAAEEGLEVGGQEHRHRPAAVPGHRLDGGHVDLVEVGPLLAVDLDVDEVLVHQRGDRRVLEALALHDVAPVAGRVADREEDRLVLGLRPRERLGAPGIPVDRVVGVLEQVRARLAGQPVGHAASVAQVPALTLPRLRLAPTLAATRCRWARDQEPTEHARPSPRPSSPGIGDAAIAYQVLGEGQPDLVYLQGWISNLELNWEHPIVERFLRGLARSRRLIIVDPRGTGVTERSSPADVASLETIMDDLAVVLDAVGSSAAAILATNELGMVANMFAATYPERTLGVIVFESERRTGYGLRRPPGNGPRSASLSRRTGPVVRGPERRHARTFGNRCRRSPMTTGSSSGGIGICCSLRHLAMPSPVSRKYMRTDIRPILPSIHVPVLVLYRPGNPESSWEPSARYLADHIVGAKLRELPGSDSYIWTGDQAAVLRAVDEFLEAMRLELAELDRRARHGPLRRCRASTETLSHPAIAVAGPPRTAPGDGSLAARSVPRHGGGHGG